MTILIDAYSILIYLNVSKHNQSINQLQNHSSQKMTFDNEICNLKRDGIGLCLVK